MSESFHIENSFFSVEIASLGAEIKKIYSKQWSREILWAPDSDNAKRIWNRTSPILFPIVGKLKNNSYIFKDKNYQMAQHGFARDKNFKCMDHNTNAIEFILEADQNTFVLYPFCFELRASYALNEEKLAITYILKNVDRQDIYFSIGAHPAFATSEIANYEIHFEQEEKGYFQLSNGLVDWQKMNKLTGRILKPRRELFLKDALIFKNVNSKFIDLVDNKKNEVIRISGTDTPFLGIWAKDSVPFVCIEPWYGVSDDNEHCQNLETKNGIQIIKMGESFEFSYSISLLSLKTL